MSKHHEPMSDGFVYSAYITLRNGHRLYAKQCGLKAFRFPASRQRDGNDQNNL